MMSRTSSMTSQISEPQSDSGCHAVARGLSPKPHGRFRSFLAGTSIWLGRRHMQKFSTVSPMPDVLEGFSITMATLLNFFKILFSLNALWPIKDLPARFHQDPSRNGRGVRWQSHKENCFYGRMCTSIETIGKIVFYFWSDHSTHKVVTNVNWIGNLTENLLLLEK